jgi:hypothetical protein
MTTVGRIVIAVTTAGALGLGLAACGTNNEVKTEPERAASTSAAPGASSVSPAPASTQLQPSATTSSSASTAARVGDVIRIPGTQPGNQLDATVVKVVDPAQPDNQFGTPTAGSRFVAVQWRITNTGTNPIDVGPTYGSAIVDAEGQQFGPTYESTTAGPAYPSSATIPPGSSRLGFVTYELPKQSVPSVVQFDPTGGLGVVGQWALR